MQSKPVGGPAARRPQTLAPGVLLGLYVLLFGGVVLAHAPLLHLPYYWDEAGYYVPAALDFFHRWTLIPTFTNAHPPLPNVVLGLLWHVFGFRVPVTRITACAFAAAGLLAVFYIARRFLATPGAAAVTLLTAAYPIWFVQSSLAHADIFAAAFTLAGLGLYLTAPEQIETQEGEALASTGRLAWAAVFFCLAALSKETAIVQPVVLVGLEIARLVRHPSARASARRWLLALAAPFPVLGLWFGYHRFKTGFTFGNPAFLRYNATANLNLDHVLHALAYHFLHLFWQRDMWVAIALALGAFLLLPPRTGEQAHALPRPVLRTITALVLGNWLAFSVLGGALLTRYLLPMYPLILLVCLSVWQTRTAGWPWLALLTGAAFISALWFSPAVQFAPEDNLTYRDMILVHQEAIRYLEQHDPSATVLTAWPGAGELTRPELGYTRYPFKIFEIENFTRPEVEKAAQDPGRFDTALVFTTRYTDPALRARFQQHPELSRARQYQKERDLSPAEIASMLHGRIVWQDEKGGEWAAVLQFNRRYQAFAGHGDPLLEPVVQPRDSKSGGTFGSKTHW
jgi:4-amino-4-deoxy-L-arabinose transferase-like glycosyltransferase